MNAPMMPAPVALLDGLLATHSDALGPDFAAYRNHCQRMVNFGIALSGDDPESVRKMAIAAAFHDLGIWTHQTFDYLPPSEELAEAYLAKEGLGGWIPEVRAMVGQHHKLTPYRSAPDRLVEAFRKADLIDVSRGLVAFGLPRAFLRDVFAAFPNSGFHKRLVQLFAKRLRTNPLSPMPMMKW